MRTEAISPSLSDFKKELDFAFGSQLFQKKYVCPSLMDLPVTSRTKCNQIFLHVTPQQTARLYMMDMKFAGATTILATPSVSLQYFLVQGPVSR
jgi:hypothetical protein